MHENQMNGGYSLYMYSILFQLYKPEQCECKAKILIKIILE